MKRFLLALTLATTPFLLAPTSEAQFPGWDPCADDCRNACPGVEDPSVVYCADHCSYQWAYVTCGEFAQTYSGGPCGACN